MTSELPPVFTLHQAAAAGFSPGQIKYRCRSGAWHRVLGSAWTAATEPPTFMSRVRAAALTHPDAVVCCRTAAVIHRIPIEDDGVVYMFARDRKHPRAGMTLRQVQLSPSDAITRNGISLTTPARTVLDCLARLADDDAMCVLSWAVTRRLFTPDDAHAFARERSGKAGNRRFSSHMPLIDSWAASKAEYRLHRMLRRAHVGGWTANTPIVLDGQIVQVADVLFGQLRKTIEVDGSRYHQDPAAEQLRDDLARAAGFQPLHIPARDLFHRPTQTLGTIRGFLALGAGMYPSTG